MQSQQLGWSGIMSATRPSKIFFHNFCKSTTSSIIVFHILIFKHRKNCECCSGHYLIENRYSSMSSFVGNSPLVSNSLNLHDHPHHHHPCPQADHLRALDGHWDRLPRHGHLPGGGPSGDSDHLVVVIMIVVVIFVVYILYAE